jgi:hypothetical protein
MQQLRPSRWLFAWPWALLLAATAAGRGAEPGLDFFEKNVRPVLVQHCYGCHSQEAKKQRGGLLLDTRTGTLKGGDSGPAVVPGKPAASLLLQAVRYTDPRLKMPPRGKLPDSVVADLEKWIAMGAPDPRDTTANVGRPSGGIDLEKGRQFWAFQPPRRPAVPAVKDTAWPRSAVDRFVLSKLEAAGLAPAPDADRAALLRRLSFALVGLPPSPQELDDFLADSSPQAVENVVDRLLASPHFGERWGRHWLDVARYADSSGGGRSLLFRDSWRYRDYVIAAFNEDKPFDQFVREQVAGDLLPAATPQQRHDQVVATGFLVLGPTNYERQDKDVLEMDVIDEQLDTIGRAFLGLTIGCARCHDHKFDPIPTRDYYALAGIFRSTQTLIHDNVSRWVDLPLPVPPEQEAVLKRHEESVAALREKIRLAQATGAATNTGAARGVLAARDLPGIVLDDGQAKKVGVWKPSTFGGTYIGQGALYDDRSTRDEKTLTFVPDFPQGGRYEVRLAYVAHENRADKVPVTILAADGEHTVHVNMKKPPPVDGRFVSLGTYRFEQGTQWFVLISTEGTTGHVSVDAVQFLPEDAVKPAAPTESRKDALDVKKLEDELKKLMESGPTRPVAMAVKEAAKIEDGFICIRGNTHNRGETVPRGFLQVLSGPAGPLPRNESGRRELASWLASRDNSLTARVFVNRVWHHLFGAGLVRTVDEFGSTGEKPSHPELLDYLAVRFMADGWSVKKLVRALVLSHAYHMSTIADPEMSRKAATADPENRLLWKMNRRRLDAECLRDAMLLAAGRLDRGVGGPTVKPGTSSEYDYKFDDVRRSVYTPVFRNKLLELFEAFDFPDPNLVSGRRNVSTTATQALYLMNNPFVLDQARAAARTLLARPGLTDTAALDIAYRTVLGRTPTATERQAVQRYLAAGGGERDDPAKRAAAWERVYQALFASLDFRYAD